MIATDYGRVSPEESHVDQRLYHVDPAIVDYDDSYSWVVLSAADTPDHGIETYIFPSDTVGNIMDWLELEGSQRGTLSHERILTDMGYEIIPPPPE